MSTSQLFQPLKVGDLTLQHRVVLAPLTRHRSDARHVPLPNVKVYYAQRACAPGTLLISESVFISEKAGGYLGPPGIYTDEQIKAWKEVTDTVHAAGSYIYAQIRALGRSANGAYLRSHGFPYVSASDVKLSGHEESPRPLTTEEIREYAEMFTTAAVNAVEKAGFDGVEIHGANGYLIDQFIQDVTNKRSDEYGGSIENRCRFGLELVDSIAQAIGPEKTAIRLSPWGNFQEMGMKDPIPTFSYFISQLKERQPNLSFLHMIEPQVDGNVDRKQVSPDESNSVFRNIWKPRPFISAGGISRQQAIKLANTEGDLVAFGRYFISNPDIVKRLKCDIPLTRYDRSTFYLIGDSSPRGYTDYPFAEDREKV